MSDKTAAATTAVATGNESMAFLPAEYTIPGAVGKYTRFESGVETKVRILTNATLGWEAWFTKEDGSRASRRFAYTSEGFELAKKVAETNDKEEDRKPKHFWAFVVWNYGNKNSPAQVEVMEITQKSVQKSIMALFLDVDNGDPRTYDLKITKEGTGRDNTKYSVIPGKSGDLTEEIVEAYAATPVDLSQMFVEGGEVFTSEKGMDQPFPEDDFEQHDPTDATN